MPSLDRRKLLKGQFITFFFDHTLGQRQQSTTQWGLQYHAICWAYLFAVTTSLDPFPPDVEAYAIRTEEGSNFTRIYFIFILSLSILAALLNSRNLKKNIRISAALLAPIVLFFPLSLLSSTLSPYAEIGIRKLALLLTSTASLILIACTAPNHRILARSTSMFLAATLLVSFLGVALIPERAIHQAYLYQGAWRGIVSHKNFMGAILILSIYFSLFEAKHSRPTIWWMLIILSMFFLFKTESKTSLAGLFVSGAISLFLFSRLFINRFPELYFAVIASFTLLCTTFFVYGANLFEIFKIETDLTGRFPLWEMILRISDQPILGYGYDTFFNIGTASPLFSEGGTWSRFAAHAHNGYLNIYIFGGLLGLLAVYSFFVSSYWQAFRAARVQHESWIIFSIIIFETIRNVTEVDTFTGTRVTFSLTIVAGLILAQIAAASESELCE